MIIILTNEIKWELGDLQETLKNDWGLFVVWGKDNNGHKHVGSIQTFISDPIIEDVYDIEKL